MSISAIIPAAGIGSRFSSTVKKQFYEIDGHPVLYYTLSALKKAWDFKQFIIGAGEDDFDYIRSIVADMELNNVAYVLGGKERSDTVYNCVSSSQSDFVLIHDAVRPFVAPSVTKAVIEKGMSAKAAICALPVRDTVKRVSGGQVSHTEDRNTLILSHTPQVFEAALVKKALEFIRLGNQPITDEAQAIELLGETVSWVPSNAENIKITFSEDTSFLESMISKFFK